MTAPRGRLDAELVRRGLARSREQAGELVAAGLVAVAGQRASKPATQVARDAPITVTETDEPGYVSRGGYKLAGALEVFGGHASRGVCARRHRRPGQPRRHRRPGQPRRHRRPGQQGRPPEGARQRSGRGGPERPGRRGVHRRLHRRAAAGRRRARGGGRRGLRPAGLVAAHRPPGHGHGPGQRAGPGAGHSGARPGGGRPLVHLAHPGAARPGGRRDARGGLRPAGQAPVRGGQGPGRCGGRGARHHGPFGLHRKSGRRGGRARPRRPGDYGESAAGPAGNVEYFLWLRRGAPPLDQEQLRRAIAEGPSGVRADRGEREDEESARAERTSPRGKRS